MIYIFKSCKVACIDAPAQACETCEKSCASFSCAPFVWFCGILRDVWMSLTERPLSLYVLLTVGIGTAQIGYSAHEIFFDKDLLKLCAFPEGLGKQVGPVEWLKGEIGFALISIFFAFYLQARFWNEILRKRLEEGTPIPDEPEVTVAKGIVLKAMWHVFLYDFVVCFYFFVLIGGVYWSHLGTKWIGMGLPGPAYCDPGHRPGHVAALGALYPTLLFLFACNWICWHTCCVCFPSDTQVPAAALRQVQAMGYCPPGGASTHAYAPVVTGQPVPGPSAAGAPAAGYVPGAERAGPSGDTAMQRACTPGQLCKLIVCIIIDLIGDATYLIPDLGEGIDFVWGPTQALLLKGLFDGGGVAAFGLVEEIMPFTDIIPTACLAWCLETIFTNSTLTRRLGLCPDKVGINPESNAPRSSGP